MPQRDTVNRRIVLAARPHGLPTPRDFRLEEAAMPTPGEGQVLLRTLYLSLDPYMRNLMDETGPAYAPSVKLGEMERPSLAPGGLGIPAFTAYVGLPDIGRPEPGETVVVAAATGAVGAVVGQIARLKGARVVGIAGGAEKCRYAVEALGFDACLDRRDPQLAERLAAACPDGIDVYFENVGGPVLDAVLPLLNVGVRVPVCGFIFDAFRRDMGEWIAAVDPGAGRRGPRGSGRVGPPANRAATGPTSSARST
ncbi:MAG TPA: zinc-binding dehydrogenase [Thermodesulfobacteriota bacterium]